MQEYLEAIILGIIQGLTEFLPVSSSGHLELAKFILQDESMGEASLLMTTILHAATALSTLFVFRKDVWEIIQGLFRKEWNEDKAFAVKIMISMIPAVIVGLAFDDLIASLFNQRLVLVGTMLLITAVLLILADYAKETLKKVKYFSAFIIGISQAIAIMPGISRSGATISTSVLLGIDRYRASRFSFLMVVPLILGKMAQDILGGEIQWDASFLPLLVGFVVTFIVGIVACRWMLVLVQRAQLKYFAIYCVIIGALAILMGQLL